MFFLAILTGKKDQTQVKRRRRKEDNGEEEDLEDEQAMEQEIAAPVTTVTDGVFTMTVGPAPTSSAQTDASEMVVSSPDAFTPSPRMSCGLAVKHGFLYLYGGVFEDGDKEITFADLYRLDLHKMDEWQTLVEDQEAAKEWIARESDSEDDDDEESEESSESDEEDAMDTD